MVGKEILASNLLEPGAMFKVTDATKDTTISPGSLGFVSYVIGIDESYQDVAKTSTVIVRRGRTGKPRLMPTTLYVPVFYVNHKGFDKLLPKSGSRKYYAHIERVLPMAVDTLELDPLEFLGYAVATSRRIKHMSDKCKHRRWPESKSHPVNIFRQLSDVFEENPAAQMEKLATKEYRTDFAIKSKEMISSLIRVHIQLDMRLVNAEVNASEFLLFANKGEFIPDDAEDKTNEYKFTDDNAMLKHTVSYYKKLHSDIAELYESKKKKSS